MINVEELLEISINNKVTISISPGADNTAIISISDYQVTPPTRNTQRIDPSKLRTMTLTVDQQVRHHLNMMLNSVLAQRIFKKTKEEINSDGKE